MDSLALPGAGLPDVNNGPAILAAVATTTIIALVVVVLRLYVRIGMLRAIGPDDYFVISAMVGLSRTKSAQKEAVLTGNRYAPSAPFSSTSPTSR
jgi:hypothetical protein